MLTFSDYNVQTPSATYGHWQPASSTVTYSNGDYGCNSVRAYSFSSQTLTVSESQ
jgi:hypothetical protein